ncbi:MAG: hypothetical protein R2716_00680 [Microthrixaceae bacterium]
MTTSPSLGGAEELIDDLGLRYETIMRPTPQQSVDLAPGRQLRGD